jgi:hypothetical protein
LLQRKDPLSLFLFHSFSQTLVCSICKSDLSPLNVIPHYELAHPGSEMCVKGYGIQFVDPRDRHTKFLKDQADRLTLELDRAQRENQNLRVNLAKQEALNAGLKAIVTLIDHNNSGVKKAIAALEIDLEES